jgi:hypothetical protein
MLRTDSPRFAPWLRLRLVRRRRLRGDRPVLRAGRPPARASAGSRRRCRRGRRGPALRSGRCDAACRRGRFGFDDHRDQDRSLGEGNLVEPRWLRVQPRAARRGLRPDRERPGVNGRSTARLEEAAGARTGRWRRSLQEPLDRPRCSPQPNTRRTNRQRRRRRGHRMTESPLPPARRSAPLQKRKL